MVCRERRELGPEAILFLLQLFLLRVEINGLGLKNKNKTNKPRKQINPDLLVESLGFSVEGSGNAGKPGKQVIDSGRGSARAEDAQGTPTQSHISPSIL